MPEENRKIRPINMDKSTWEAIDNVRKSAIPRLTITAQVEVLVLEAIAARKAKAEKNG